MKNFRIADTFTDSLAKLNHDEQKTVKTAAFDLQLNPANPGMQFHKLEKCKDPNFWSIRVSRDIRIIVHKTAENLLLCYVDHHDKAYQWAERRKLETHPTTGAAQLVEIRERVEEVQPQASPKPYAEVAKERRRTKTPWSSRIFLPKSFWATGFRPSGWRRYRGPTKTGSWSWPNTCLSR